MIFFDREEIVALHQANVERFGGSLGLRDEGALLSAIEAPEKIALFTMPPMKLLARRLTVFICVRRTLLWMETSVSRRSRANFFCSTTAESA